MEVQVYDTHVRTHDGRYLHFDVLVEAANASRARSFARQWLASRGIDDADIAQGQCDFCHREAATPEVLEAIARQGHFILPLQDC